ncbi:MAG: J domain-containing protein [Thermodesulfobacteriota bacterium]
MKNYYIILGISPQANADGVRQAFREKAKQYHPDKTGQEGTSFFQDITEAYEVLSDPKKRSEYNRRLHKKEDRPGSENNPRSRPAPASESPPEDLFSGRFPFGGSPFDRDPFFDFRFGRRTGRTRPRENPPNLDLEVILSAEEARHGFSTTLELPFTKVCPACRGASASDLLLSCRRCGGSGFLSQDHRVRLTLPGGIREGDRTDIPVQAETGYRVLLRLHFRIQSS